jgi:acyl carrier protein
VGETNGKGDSKSEVVREVTRIWSEVLGTEKIGLHDNLFDLGGHSLLITQIISRIRKSLRVEIPIHHFFEDPTVAVISRFIEKQLQEKPAGSAKASTGGNSFGEMRRRGAVGNPKL